MNIPNLKRGDRVDVFWVDLCEDPNGDPRKAGLWERGPTTARFWGSTNSHGMRCGVFSSTYEPKDPSQQGYFILPWRLVLKVSKKK